MILMRVQHECLLRSINIRILTSSREMGLDEGLRKKGELSLASVTVMSMDTMLMSLRGAVLEASATL